MNRITIGLDHAKRAFQVRGVEEAGDVVARRRRRRSDVLTCAKGLLGSLVGREAWCGSAHHRAREWRALGHDDRLMPPCDMKPYLSRSKTDAEAICEAPTRPTMRFVPPGSAGQQSVLMLRRARDLLTRQRTVLANAPRAHLSELGIAAARGMANLAKLVPIVSDERDDRIPLSL